MNSCTWRILPLPHCFLRTWHFLFLSLTLAFCLSLILPSAADATLTCAARIHSKPSLSVFRKSVKNVLQGTFLLAKSLNINIKNQTAFDYATDLFYSNHYSPKDVVCIADSEETQESLENSPIWETYWGTTVLLSPVPVHPPETRYGPRDSNVFTAIAEAVARTSIPHDCRLYMGALPGYRTAYINLVDTYPYEECLREYREKVAKHKHRILSGLPTRIIGIPNLSIVETYDPNEPNGDSNAIALEAFIGTVAIIETINAPFYLLPMPTEEQPAAPQFRVFDPITHAKLPVTSLVRFVGRELVDRSIALMFREYGRLANEFEPANQSNPHGVPEIQILSHTRLRQANERSFPYSDAYEQMLRTFICRNGGYSGVGIFDLDPKAVLFEFQKMACPSYEIEGKEVIDLVDSLLSSSRLDPKLGIISQEEINFTIKLKLTELAQIELDQSKILNQIHKYVADGVLGQRLTNLHKKLAVLEASKLSFIGKAANIVGAIGTISAGYGGIGALFGGIQEIHRLYEKMPKEDFDETKEYVREKREEFSLAANTTANGVAKVVRALNRFEGIIRGRENSREIQQVKAQIRAIEDERKKLFREIAKQARNLEEKWLVVAEELFWARSASRSAKRNVALILEDTIANKFIFSLQTENFYGEFTGCVTTLTGNSGAPESIAFSPIQATCGNIYDAINEVKKCLNNDGDALEFDLVVEGKTKVFRIGRDTKSKECYGNWLWRANRGLL